MAQHFFMVNLVLGMHGTNNSTAMKFFTTTSHGIQGKRAVPYINFVSVDVAAVTELISFIIFVIGLAKT